MMDSGSEMGRPAAANKGGVQTLGVKHILDSSFYDRRGLALVEAAGDGRQPWCMRQRLRAQKLALLRPLRSRVRALPVFH